MLQRLLSELIVVRVPLAWRNLTASKKRLAISTSGIVFAVVLMFMQIGFRNALLDSSVEMMSYLNGNLFLISSTKYRLLTNDPFPLRRVHQARGIPGVTDAWPLYIETEAAVWKNPLERSSHAIRVLGFDPNDEVFALPVVRDQQRVLLRPDTVLLDDRSREFVGIAPTGTKTELTGRSIEIVGHFTLGADFAVDGNLMTSDRTFERLFGNAHAMTSRLALVEIGVLRVADAGQIVLLQTQLQKALGHDVAVLTRPEFMAFERRYWEKASPVGFVFGLGTVVGFVVGVMICYQILFTDLSDQLPQFATLKAIGYDNGFLRRVVLVQSMLLSIFGYVPALGLSLLLYKLISVLAGLQMRLSGSLIVVMFGLTVVMCVLSGSLAVRKVLSTDPAEVF